MALPRKITNQLTARQCETAASGLIADGGGLYLQTTPGGKSWVYRYQLGGKRRDMGLGSFPLRSLADARIKAQEAARLVMDRIDPIEARKAARVAELPKPSFAECCEKYVAKARSEWSSRHEAIWLASMAADVLPVIGKRPVDTIDDRAVLDVLESIWSTKRDTASRIRGRIESVLDWAKAAKLRSPGENPARWRGHLDQLLSKKSKTAKAKHFAAAGIDDVPAIMGALAAIDSIGSRSLRFTILTCARAGETFGATWQEIDLERRLWIIPAGRMLKSDKEHRVPLSGPALAILADMATIGSDPAAYIFPGRAGATQGHSTMTACLATVRDRLTVHGFRSSFRDWCAERTDFPNDAAELALAHTVGSKVELAYRRGDQLAKRFALSEAWAAHCGQAESVGA